MLLVDQPVRERLVLLVFRSLQTNLSEQGQLQRQEGEKHLVSHVP